MAEENPTEEDQKTEDPTERRLEKAFEEGKIAYSRELLHWSILASAAALLLWLIPYSMKSFMKMIASVFENCGDEVFTAYHSPTYLRIFWEVLKNSFLLLPLVAVVLAVGFGQTKLNFTLSQIQPKFERISPKSGLNRLLGKKSIVEFFKNLVKIAIVASVMFWAVKGYMNQILLWSTISLSSGLHVMKDIFSTLFLAALSVLALIAGLDYTYQRFSFWKMMKMSRQEIKDEHKEQEGNPQIKGKLREMRMQRVRDRMGAKVKTATVVVTNPTHYAIAIQWDENIMDAPRVVAKGVDYLAEQIRKIAKENKVPIIENPPLARSLYAKIKVDQEIDPEHYRAVAEVIKLISELAQKRF